MLNRRQLIGACAGLAAIQAVPVIARESGFFRRGGRRLGLQIYTLGDAPRTDLDGTLRRVAEMGYRELELPGFLGHTPEQWHDAVTREGLSIQSVHVPYNQTYVKSMSMEDDPARIAAAIHAVGAQAAILPVLPLPKIADIHRKPGEEVMDALWRQVGESGPDTYKKLADFLNTRGAILKREGIQLGYHNHNIEFAPLAGGRSGWQILVAETDPAIISFEIDIGWVAAAGLDPVVFLADHAGRVRWMHVKDLKASTKPNFALKMDPTEVGSGSIDWKRVLPAASEAGVRHFYVEQEPPFAIDRFEAAAKSATFLKAHV